MMITVDTLTEVITRLLPEPHAGLMSGMLFGAKQQLSQQLFDQLVTTGTLHIVALSGMNITILISLVQSTLLRQISRQAANVLTACIIIGFIWFVGPATFI